MFFCHIEGTSDIDAVYLYDPLYTLFSNNKVNSMMQNLNYLTRWNIYI